MKTQKSPNERPACLPIAVLMTHLHFPWIAIFAMQSPIRNSLANLIGRLAYVARFDDNKAAFIICWLGLGETLLLIDMHKQVT